MYRSLTGAIRAAERSAEPDLVHVAYGGVLALGAARTVRRPLVISYCGSDLLGGAAGGIARRARGRVGVWASHRAARRASWIVVKSENLRRALAASVDGGRVTVIPNGVDLEQFSPVDRAAARARLGWDAGNHYVLFPAARSRPEKRFELARDAVAELGRRGTDVVLHTLEDVPRAEVPAWLNAVDVVLLTSVSEGSPNVVKEALACGTPVVSVDVGDVRERISGLPGCAVARAAPGELASGLAAAIATDRSDDLRQSVEELSHERTAARLIEVYEHALSARVPNGVP